MSVVQCDGHLKSFAWKLEQNICVKGRRHTLEQNVMFVLFLALETILGLLHRICAGEHHFREISELLGLECVRGGPEDLKLYGYVCIQLPSNSRGSKKIIDFWTREEFWLKEYLLYLFITIPL